MGGRRLRLTTRNILGWADNHFTLTGRWPTYRSGTVRDAPEWNWFDIDECLEYGGSGLPGGLSLAQLLARHRGLTEAGQRPRLSTKLILIWADRHAIRNGRYPKKSSGPIEGVPGESWWIVDRALRVGERGLPGGISLEKFLSRHRGKALERERPRPLAVTRILAWADEHRARTGFWPKFTSGPIHDQPRDSWAKIDAALRVGLRGLPGGSSLAQLLIQRRGKLFRERRRRLTHAMILEWADKHRERTGDWPHQKSGPVADVAGETWWNIDDALRVGRSTLPGGSSLPTLLEKYRGRRHMGRLPPLTVPMILDWARRHHRRTGKWPTMDSGPVLDAPNESWRNVDAALQRGGRGLPVKTTLARLLTDIRGTPPRNRMPKLSVSRILDWADRHRARTGHWPIETSGTVVDAPENTWSSINAALVRGSRGLPGGTSLARLLMEKRGKRVRTLAPRLTLKQILQWVDRHHRRTGEWPAQRSGPVLDAPGESWHAIDLALRQGHRGLAGGSSLTKLLDGHRSGWRRP